MVEFMQFTSDKGGVLTKEEFIIAAGLTGELLIKAITGSLSITNFLEFKKALQNIFDICRCEDRGKVFFLTLATPKKNHDAWEAAFITINGRTAHFGDGEEKFTIQSAIKPIMYALAVELLGVDEVMKIVGMTYHCGRIDDVNAFNEKGIPKNANINTGGIALCSHIKHVGLKNKTKAQIFDYVVQFLKDLSGNKYVSFSNISYMAEKETISKNKSIIYYLKKKKCLAPNADLDDLDFYFATCSIEVTTHSLSVMGATIANYGINPLTGKEVLKAETCKYTMAMMQYCSPTPSWLNRVGLPAARGASGAFLVMLPKLFALCLYSPKIDPYYNSYRAKSFCKAMDHQYNLNMFYASSRLGKTTEEDKTVKVFKPCPWHCSLYAIATTGTAITLASTLTDDIKPCYTNFLGRNLLHDAAAAGNMQCVSFFMQACPHMLEKKDCLGFTPLDDAKFFKHDNVINYLEKWISLRTATPLPKKE
ncbi:glutaminase liver isoform, mitochondrial isoform X2 [Halyomorpha halys]|nr:glutaminase liver isoform, mitochondrial-like isoform X2 [Halyomorpha halys]